MKKFFGSYLIIWAISLVLFCAGAFAIPLWAGVFFYTVAFWIGFGMVFAMFAMNLICALVTLKTKDLDKMFHKASILRSSYISLVFAFVIGLFLITLSPYGGWVAIASIALSAIIIGFSIISIIKANAAVTAVVGVEKQIKIEIAFMNKMVLEAKTLASSATSEELRSQAKRVYDALYYSDAISTPALDYINTKIALQFKAFSDSVREEDAELSAENEKVLLSLIDERSVMAKASK